MLDLDARKVRSVIDGPGNATYPNWSPDGTRFVFSSDRDGDYEIFIADENGGNLQKLTENSFTDEHPSWHPDGQSVIYAASPGSTVPRDDANIYQVGLSGGQPRQITRFKGRNSTPRYSPDATRIAFSTDRYWPGWEVCLFNTATEHEDCPLGGPRTFCRPAWSKSGDRLAYSFGAFDGVDLGVYTLEQDRRSTLAASSKKEYDVTWGPKDELWIFAGDGEDDDVYSLYLVNSDLKQELLLTAPYSLRYPSWSELSTMDLEAQRRRAADGLPAFTPPVSTPSTTPK